MKPIFIDALTQGIITVVNDALSNFPIGNRTFNSLDDAFVQAALEKLGDRAVPLPVA